MTKPNVVIESGLINTIMDVVSYISDQYITLDKDQQQELAQRLYKPLYTMLKGQRDGMRRATIEECKDAILPDIKVFQDGMDNSQSSANWAKGHIKLGLETAYTKLDKLLEEDND